MTSIHSIAVVGSGAVGCYYGAKLAQRSEVSFLMRRDLEAVRQNGLIIHSVEEGTSRHPVKAFASTDEIGPVDLVLIALKATSNPILPSILPPLLRPGTILLTLQNGLGNEAFLKAAFPGHPILGGLCFVCINRGKPGVIHHLAHGRIEMGELTETDRLESVVALFTTVGLDCEGFPDLELARWRKLVWNVPFNGISIAMGGIDTQQILAEPALLSRTRALMHEIIDTASALGHVIELSFAEKNIRGTLEMGAYRPSSLIDYLAGNAVEVEAIWGEALRQAKSHRVATPELEKLYLEICRATGNAPR